MVSASIDGPTAAAEIEAKDNASWSCPLSLFLLFDGGSCWGTMGSLLVVVLDDSVSSPGKSADPASVRSLLWSPIAGGGTIRRRILCCSCLASMLMRSLSDW